MTIGDFRKLALASAGASESEHMNHPDFRVEGRIFASLGFPNKGWGMVKLTPEQQRLFIRKAPSVFKRYNGVWGERGATNVLLELATKRVLRVALDAARENVAIRTKRNRA